MRFIFKFFLRILKYFVKTFIFIIIFLFTLGLIGSVIINEEKQKEELSTHSILKLKFDTPLNNEESLDFPNLLNLDNFKLKKAINFRTFIKIIQHAKNNDKVDGIYLDLNNFQIGLSKSEEILEALEDFKTSKKWIIAYANSYNQGSYYLATVADKIYLQPAGSFEMSGLSTELMFFKNTLEKLDLELQVFKHGKFKSAVEPFLLEKMSPENRSQIESILNSIWSNYLTVLSNNRPLSAETINELVDDLKLYSAKSALDNNFVDGLKYMDEVEAMLREKTKVEKNKKLSFAKVADYLLELKKDRPAEKNKIALVYAEGEIVDGKKEHAIYPQKLVYAIRKAKEDSNAKAIVLRVNSPGGSALASDIIAREVLLAKKVKPVVVSMGSVAASGGYYISCFADKIVANKFSITGSIGVFGLIPNTKKFFNKKLGVTFDLAKTNEHKIVTIFSPLDKRQKEVIQESVEDIYTTFITKVSEGRGIPVEQVDEIGQGRVWTGTQGKEIQLVNEIASFDKAIKIAAKLANIKNYKEMTYPIESDNILENIIEEVGNISKVKTTLGKMIFGSEYSIVKKITSLTDSKCKVYARMPYNIIIK